jgi:hypothetical protein
MILQSMISKSPVCLSFTKFAHTKIFNTKHYTKLSTFNRSKELEATGFRC